MKKELDDIQISILEYLDWIDERNAWLTLRDIAWELWIKHPQTVLNKINQLISKGYLSKVNSTYKVLKKINKDLFYIPVYWLAQCWNLWTALLNSYSQEKIPVTFSFIWTADVENCFFVRAKWASMEPKIFDWDLVLINQQSHFQDWYYVLVEHNWLAKLKKIVKKWVRFFLVSVNKDFDSVEIDEFEESRVIWVIKKIIREF